MLRVVLSSLIWGFSFLLASMILTGGGTFQSEGVKIEFSSVDLWFLVLASLLFLFHKLFPQNSIPLWEQVKTSLNRLVQDSRRSERAAYVFLGIILSLLVSAHILRNWSFGTHGYDQTFLHQSLFHPFLGPFFHNDISIGGTYFGEHMSWSLILLTPLTKFFSLFTIRDELIYIMQGAIVALPLLIGLKQGPLRGQHHVWLLSLVIIFASRALRNSLVWDFREDHLAFAFLLLACISLYRQKWKSFLITAFFAAGCKENVPFVVGFFVFPILFSKEMIWERKRRVQLALALLSITFFVIFVNFKVLIPMATGGATAEKGFQLVNRLQEYGSNPAEVVRNILTTPSIWFSLLTDRLLNKDALKYILLLTGPFLFFLRNGKWWLMPVLPGLAMNLLPQVANQRSLNFHYDLIILPFLIFASWLGLASLEKNKKKSLTLAHQLMVPLFLALMFSGRWPGLAIRQNWPNWAQVRDVFYLKEIPAVDVTGAGIGTLAHLGHIPQLRQIYFDFGRNWEDFKFHPLHRNDRTGLKGHGASQSEAFVLDLEVPALGRLARLAQGQGWIEKSVSPSGRFIYLARRNNAAH